METMTSIRTTLYKKDSKGKLRYITIDVDGKLLVKKTGIVGSDKSVEHFRECKPKNVGKSNETTAEQQAKLEAEAEITKKLKERYYKTKEEANNDSIKLPMLAKSHDKVSKPFHKHEKLVAIQPKLDGIRCIITYDAKKMICTAVTRKNRPITTIPHILVELENCFMGTNMDITLDGELYVHGKTFQEVVKLVKNDPGLTGNVEYHVYDLVEESMSFSKRYSQLQNLFQFQDFAYIKLVPTEYVVNVKEDWLQKTHDKHVNNGYEGMMLRKPESKYKINGRSADLLKYKVFQDIALPIVDITPNDANPEHGTVWVKLADGQTQKVGNKISHDDAAELLINKDNYIGKTAEIRFFGYTDSNKLRMPHYHGIRIDK